jgi:YggT family protein
MFIFSNLLSALAEILDILFGALELAIVIRVILSWANADPFNGFVRAVQTVTEPLLAPFRKILPPWRLQGWDLSPFLAILALIFLRKFLVVTLLGAASRLSN